MKSEALKSRPNFWLRFAIFSLGACMLVSVYLFQRFSVASLLGDFEPNAIFVINRTVRLVLNDMACLFIILALFWDKKYLKVAFWVFLIEALVILPAYLVVKLSLEGDSEISSPLLSQIHRLIVNPMLMILLMVGFFYQRYTES